jgi:hypothetical protein
MGLSCAAVTVRPAAGGSHLCGSRHGVAELSATVPPLGLGPLALNSAATQQQAQPVVGRLGRQVKTLGQLVYVEGSQTYRLLQRGCEDFVGAEEFSSRITTECEGVKVVKTECRVDRLENIGIRAVDDDRVGVVVAGYAPAEETADRRIDERDGYRPHVAEVQEHRLIIDELLDRPLNDAAHLSAAVRAGQDSILAELSHLDFHDTHSMTVFTNVRDFHGVGLCPTLRTALSKSKLRLRDWLFGAGGKRRLLDALLSDDEREWTEAELANSAGLHTKGSVDVHVKALVQLGVLSEESLSYRVVPAHPLIEPLRDLLAVLEEIQDAELKRPP